MDLEFYEPAEAAADGPPILIPVMTRKFVKVLYRSPTTSRIMLYSEWVRNMASPSALSILGS